MATYKGIQGYSVQKLASDPTASEADGQLWYNSSTGKFNLAVAGAGAWASAPSLGDEVTCVDYAGTFDTNNLTVGRNSEKIEGTAADLTVSVERAAFTLVYTDSTQGWLLKDK